MQTSLSGFLVKEATTTPPSSNRDSIEWVVSQFIGISAGD